MADLDSIVVAFVRGRELSLREFLRALASLSFDGQLILVAWLTKQLLLLDAEGRNRSSLPLEKSIAALALGALGDSGAVALADGPVLGLDLRNA